MYLPPVAKPHTIHIAKNDAMNVDSDLDERPEQLGNPLSAVCSKIIVLIFVSVDMDAFVSAIPFMAVSTFMSVWAAHKELLTNDVGLPGLSSNTSIRKLSIATMDLQKAVLEVCRTLMVLPQNVKWPEIRNSTMPDSAKDIIAVRKWLNVHMHLTDPDTLDNSNQKVRIIS